MRDVDLQANLKSGNTYGDYTKETLTPKGTCVFIVLKFNKNQIHMLPRTIKANRVKFITDAEDLSFLKDMTFITMKGSKGIEQFSISSKAKDITPALDIATEVIAHGDVEVLPPNIPVFCKKLDLLGNKIKVLTEFPENLSYLTLSSNKKLKKVNLSIPFIKNMPSIYLGNTPLDFLEDTSDEEKKERLINFVMLQNIPKIRQKKT